MTKLYALIIDEKITGRMYIQAESEEQAKELAEKLIDNGSAVIVPDTTGVMSGTVEDITVVSNPDTDEQGNADENAEALIELNEDL